MIKHLLITAIIILTLQSCYKSKVVDLTPQPNTLTNTVADSIYLSKVETVIYDNATNALTDSSTYFFTYDNLKRVTKYGGIDYNVSPLPNYVYFFYNGSNVNPYKDSINAVTDIYIHYYNYNAANKLTYDSFISKDLSGVNMQTLIYKYSYSGNKIYNQTSTSSASYNTLDTATLDANGNIIDQLRWVGYLPPVSPAKVYVMNYNYDTKKNPYLNVNVRNTSIFMSDGILSSSAITPNNTLSGSMIDYSGVVPTNATLNVTLTYNANNYPKQLTEIETSNNAKTVYKYSYIAL